MSEMHPYRDRLDPPEWTEEELWQELDSALECVFTDKSMSWALAWNVLCDSQRLRFTAVEIAAVSLLHELTPGGMPADWDLPTGRLDIRAAVAVEE